MLKKEWKMFIKKELIKVKIIKSKVNLLIKVINCINIKDKDIK
jgi:hypothetical protein